MTDTAALISAVEEAKKLDKEATAGPWAVTFYQEEHHVAALLIPPHAGGLLKIMVDGRQQFTNPEPAAEFIARSRTLLPLLASGVERLVEENAAKDASIADADRLVNELLDRIFALEQQLATLTRERDESDAILANFPFAVTGASYGRAIARHRAKSQEGEAE